MATPPLPVFELLTRAGCGLCDELHRALGAALAARQACHPILLRDVDADPELKRRFGLQVPVLRLGGAVLCAHRLDTERLDAALEGRPWEPLELR